jgi:hypothetical protein
MKTHISLILSLALAGTVLSHVSTARADDQAATDMARERFKEGVRYYDSGQYEKARASFLQAYALKAHPSVLLNLAQSELLSGHEAEAAAHFSEFLASAPDAKPEETAAAQKGFDEAKAKVGEVPVTVDVAGAEVFVDGTSVGKAPLPRPLYLAPGTHSLEARSGENKATAEVTATAGASSPTSLTVKPPPPPPAAPAPTATRASVAAPSLTEPDSADSGRPPFFSWLVTSPIGLTGLGLTVAGAGVGVAGAIIATDHYDSAKEASTTIAARAGQENVSGTVCSGGTSANATFAPACAERQDRLDQGDTWRTVSIVGFAGAAVFGVGTVVYYLVGTRGQAEVATADTSEQKRTALIPVVGRDVQGMSLVGSF